MWARQDHPRMLMPRRSRHAQAMRTGTGSFENTFYYLLPPSNKTGKRGVTRQEEEEAGGVQMLEWAGRRARAKKRGATSRGLRGAPRVAVCQLWPSIASTPIVVEVIDVEVRGGGYWCMGSGWCGGFQRQAAIRRSVVPSSITPLSISRALPRRNRFIPRPLPCSNKPAVCGA
jgi:hypothetical protein